MKNRLSIFAVDAHTTGSPVRLVTSGIPTLRGANISEKMEYMKTHYDHIRNCILQPPRGCPSLMCAVLTEPVSEKADYGLFYMDAGGYQPMCGAGTLAVSKILAEIGMVPEKDGKTQITYETGAGIVRVLVETDETGESSVTMENAPAFVYRQDQEIEIPGFGVVHYDLVFGGNFFAMVDTKQLGFSITPETIPQMQEWMPRLVEAISREVAIEHPENPALNYLNEILFIQEGPESDGGYLAQVIFGNCQVDISPCGTGTSGRMAWRYANGLLKQGEDFIQTQVYGGRFYGKVLRETKIGDYPAIVPQIRCSDVHITGYNHLIASEDDRLRYGMLNRTY